MRSSREFAFDFAAQDQDWLRTRFTKFGAACRQGMQSFSLYLDTPDHKIAKLGYGIGLRRRGPKNPVPLKSRSRLAPHFRWGRFIETIASAPRAYDTVETCLRELPVREALGLALACENEETVYTVQFGTARFEIRIDTAGVAAAGESFGIGTATFRHTSGDNTDFLSGVAKLADPIKLRLSEETALVRAHRRAGIEARRYVGAFAPRLGRAMDMRTAFQAIARACCDQFLLNEASIRELRDPEAVHQSRVALRRLRTALRLFRLNKEPNASWRRDLKQISALLRDARDLDVLLSEQLQPLFAAAQIDDADVFLQEVEQRRQNAYDRLVAALQGTKVKRFYLELALWIEAGNFGQPENWNETIVGFMHKRLSREMHKLLKRGKQIETDTTEERHETRIKAKNLRYSAEFLELLLAGKSTHERYTAFLAALKDIQQILGDHNDEIAARHFFTELTEDPRLAEFRDRLAIAASGDVSAADAEDPSEEKFLQKAQEAFRSLADAKPFWTKIADSAKPQKAET